MPVQDDAGLNWTIIVAVPRHDFLHRIVETIQQTVGLGILASLIVVLIGSRF